MSKYLIVGAGRIGTAVRTLLERRKVDVTLVDTTLEAANWMLSNTPTHLISALPYNACIEAAMLAARKKVGVYCDFTEDKEVREEVQKLSEVYPDTCFIPCCGLAPGYVNIMAGRMMKLFQHVDSVKIYCGALPASKQEDYKISWNVEGLINLYTSRCEIIRNGAKEETNPLKDIEEVTVHNIKYEAALTSGGLGTMVDMKNVPTTMFYKTLRYPGHFDLIKTLMDRFNRSKEQLIEMFSCLDTISWDMVAIKIVVVGRRDIDAPVNSNIHLIHDEVLYPDGKMTALQYATAHGALMALDSPLVGTKPFLRQEEL